MKEINIGQSILNKRRKMGLTQDELADYIGVTKASVSKWETGQSYPDITLLPQLAAYFDISIDELMGYSPQLTKEAIRALYMKFSAAFSSSPFDKVMDEVNGAVKKYYSCYPFLIQMAILLLNHYSLTESRELQSLVLEHALAICKRIKGECKDILLTQQANSMEAMVYLMLQQPAEAIDLLCDITLRPFNQDEMVLASAYEMRGDAEAAKKVLQIAGYQHVLFMTGSAVKLLPLYKTDNSRFEEILSRALSVAEAFHIETLHPNAFIQLSLTAALCLTELGSYQRALDMLDKSADAFANFKFPVILQGDAYFDLIDDWLAGFDLGGNAPRDAGLIKKSFLEMLKIPPLAPLFDFPEYKRIIARAERMGEVK